MPLPKPTMEELKNDDGKASFTARCMRDASMTNEFENEKQRIAICNYLYQKSKDKMVNGNLTSEINHNGITNCLVKIKTNNLIESRNFQENQELAAAFLKNNGIKKYKNWFLSIDRSKEGCSADHYTNCITSDFENVDIAALESIMEVAASVDDKAVANKASELLSLALKVKSGQKLSTIEYFTSEKGVSIEASF